MNKKKFQEVINCLNTVLDKNGDHLKVGSIIVSQGKKYYSHYYSEDIPVDVRSIAKPIVCIAIGIAIENGLFFDNKKIDLDTHIWEFVSKYAHIEDTQLREKWKNITLMDCFRITLGHDKGIMFSADIKNQNEFDLVNYVVNYPISKTIGSDFVYSNAGTYIVSSLVSEYLGKSLDELVNELLFSPLGITDFSWKKYGKYCAGCTGLKLKNSDLHKIGKLLINDGCFEEKQLISKSWIKKMKTPQVDAPTHRFIADRAFPKWSYGMNLWICEDGNYYCDGTEGQYLKVLPDKDMVVSTLAYQSDSEPLSKCLGMLK